MNETRQFFPSCRGLLLAALLSSLQLVFPVFAHDVHEERALHTEPQDQAGQAPRSTVHEGRSVRGLLQSFRETGDDARLDEAWQLVEPALAAGPRHPDLLVDAALIAQARHEFDLALELTGEALERRSSDGQAWLLLASIQLVRGDTAAAGEACDRLRRLPPLLVVGCHARVAHAAGGAQQVRPQLERLLARADRLAADAPVKAWAYGIAGDLAVAAGDDAAAIRHFSHSLRLAESAQLRSALVDVYIRGGRYDEAARILAGGAKALPLELRRMIVATRLGRADEVAARIKHADREFRDWIAAGDWLHAREMARFYVDVVAQPALARRLAEINLGIQKEPEDLLLEWRTRPENREDGSAR